MLEINAIQALDDNYIWCIKADKKSNKCYFVDFGDITAAKQAIKDNNLDLQGILITHHHWDHTDGIVEFLKTYKNSADKSPAIYGYKGDAHRLPSLDFALADKDEFYIFDKKVKTFFIPGHTLGHIAYVIYDDPNHLFCGDTLFSAGCGRTFEGTYEQMTNSLMLLAKLDAKTLVYPAHEYTLANLKFAEYIEPKNTNLAGFTKKIKNLRANNKPSLPNTLAEELQINPFLRLENPQIIARLEEILQRPLSREKSEIFKHLRQLKDNF